MLGGGVCVGGGECVGGWRVCWGVESVLGGGECELRSGEHQTYNNNNNNNNNNNKDSLVS